VSFRTESLTESRAQVLRLTSSEAEALQLAGRQLASDRLWWGADALVDDRTVIQCQRMTSHEWQVTVAEAVGVIVVGESLQINVAPKIPQHHLLYLFSQSDVFPGSMMVGASGRSARRSGT
jgi:hypothetical protein